MSDVSAPPWSDRWRRWRRRFKASLPYVRRREHRVLQQKYAALIEAIDGAAGPATDAALHWARPLEGTLGGEVCIFVTFADAPQIKPHVLAHIEWLAGAGIGVILVVNTDLAADAVVLDPRLAACARAVAIRQNRGFDFGAWAHALALLGDTARWSRLFLVNDSVVGPLDASAFERLLARIRASTADVIGLTEALAPRRHLQSYFLVMGPRALRSDAVQRFFAGLRNWPDKIQVIDVCEARLTAVLEADGLRAEALFPSLSGDALASDDTSLRWAELVQRGLPYLKTRVIAAHAADPRVAAWLAAAPRAPTHPPPQG